MKLPYRTQRLQPDENGFNRWESVISFCETIPSQTAVILCDVWDNHWNRAAVMRLEPLLKPMNDLCAALREQGVWIIHAPSDTISFYAGTPARERMRHPCGHALRIVLNLPDPLLPLDASDGGNDANVPDALVNQRVWTRQHPAITIDQQKDGISDDGPEIFACLQARGITRVLLMGVHTNMCILNRSYGIKNLVRWGMNAALIRDLTDPMYNPAMPPYVNHGLALELMTGFIEKFWCPTIGSEDLRKAFCADAN
jgi:nicotinamidase-related amidase